MPLGEVPDHEGRRVAVEARVLEVRGAFLVLSDGAHRLSAFAPRDHVPARGDLVRAEGLVTRLADGPGLSLDALVVVEPAATRALSPSDLSERPEAFDGARVLLRGEIRDGALVGGGARVRLRGEPVPDAHRASAADWLAQGVFHYRPEETAYVLRVESWTRAT